MVLAMQRFIKCFVITFVLASLPLLSFSCTHVPAGKVAFVSTKEDPEHGTLSLYVMNPDGSNQTKVSPKVTKHGPFVNVGPGRGFLWSPAGTEIAFHASEISPRHHWLCVVNADGTNLTKLVEINLGYIYGTSWSPDGRRIALGWFDGYTCDIYSLDLDTSELKNLTATSAIEEAWPSWSPDGQKIAFITALIDPSTQKFTSSGICLMDTDGGKQSTLLSSSDPANYYYDGPLAWSPDGKKILHLSVFYKPRMYANGDICLIDVKTGEEVNLSNSPDIHDGAPSWSPEGKKILFTSNPGGNREIYVMDADGTNLTKLTDGRGSKSSPSWSPNGKKIVFTIGGWRPIDDEWVSTDDIYIMDADGSNVINLTGNTPGDDNYCLWSPR